MHLKISLLKSLFIKDFLDKNVQSGLPNWTKTNHYVRPFVHGFYNGQNVLFNYMIYTNNKKIDVNKTKNDKI